MDIKADLQVLLDSNSVLCQQPMAKYTSFRVGGAAQYMVLPRDYNQVCQVIRYCNHHHLPWYVLGKGTNLLVSDCGVQGVVICIDENLAEVRVSGNTIVAQAGAALPRVSSIARASGLSGLEFAAGIPGTVGGAVVMNAGAYDGEMKDVLRRVLAITPEAEFITYSVGEMELGYRTSIFQHNKNIILEVEMELCPGEPAAIAAKVNELNQRRREKQPLDIPSAGSTFKRPPGHFAGKLIEDCGLRGHRIGGAAVSDKHCGFIINDGQATAQDIYNLIRHVQKQVREHYGIELQPEVKLWGKFEE